MSSPGKNQPMPLVIYGAGPLARLMHFYFTVNNDYEVSHFCIDREYLNQESFCGLPLIPFDQVEEICPPQTHQMFVAIGYKQMRARKLLFDRAKEKGYRCASYVSPHAIVNQGAVMGENNVLMDQVVMEPFSRMGDNNLYWSGTLISHGCLIGNHNYVSAKVVIGGESTMEDGCFLGNTACTINNIVLREETMLLPGAVAHKDCLAFTKYFGNPAKPVGTHQEKGIIIERG